MRFDSAAPWLIAEAEQLDKNRLAGWRHGQSETGYDVLSVFMIGISLRLLVFILLRTLASAAVLQAQRLEREQDAVSFAVAPAPAWVKPVTAPTESAVDESAGTFYLLVDRQKNV